MVVPSARAWGFSCFFQKIRYHKDCKNTEETWCTERTRENLVLFLCPKIRKESPYVLKVNVPKEVRGTFGTWICSGRVANSFDEAGIPLPIPRIIHTKYGNLVKFKIAIDDQYRKGRAIILDVKADGDMAEKVCRMKWLLSIPFQLSAELRGFPISGSFTTEETLPCMRVRSCAWQFTQENWHEEPGKPGCGF